MANSAQPTIKAIAGCRERIERICAGLGEEGWRLPTALPAWDVKDVVAHLGSLDALLLGRDEPAHQAAVTAHVRNPLGELNERLVDRRRSWSPAQVLDEFRDATGARLEELCALSEADLDREVPSPRGGTMVQRDLLGVRLWDYLVHDLDISEALGLDLDAAVDSAAGRRVLDEMLALVPRAAARGGVAEGGTVTLEIDPPLARAAAARVEGGRGLAAPATPGEATLHLRASPATFLRVGSGRRDPVDAIAAGDVDVTGDAALAARVLRAINVVP